jgi:hypothetical protein
MKTFTMIFIGLFITLSAHAKSTTQSAYSLLELSSTQTDNCPERFFVSQSGQLDKEKLQLCMAFSDLADLSWDLINTPRPPFQIADQDRLADWTTEMALTVRDILRAIPADDESAKKIEAILTKEIRMAHSDFEKVQNDLSNNLSSRHIYQVMERVQRMADTVAQKVHPK